MKLPHPHPHQQALPAPVLQRHCSRPVHRSTALQRCLVVLPLLAGATSAMASDALASKHGCLGCHAKAAQLVGPSYAAVADKYKGQADAAKQLAARIRSGGAGRWGDVPMPPQAQVKDADALRLAQWILADPK